MNWVRILSAMGVMALAISSVSVSAQEQLNKGKGKGNQGGGNTQSGGGGSKGQGNQGGGLGNQGKGGGSSQGSGLGKGQGNQGGGSSSGSGWGNSGGLGNQGGGFGNKGQGNSGSGRGNGDQLGRIDNPTNRGQNSLGKGNDRGRLGNSNYGSTNNSRDRFDIRQAPTQILSKGSLTSQVLRSEQIRVNSQFRNGYYSYYNNWRDDYFYYPYYQFSPYQNNCSFSPWYYYPHLPAYISIARIFYVSDLSWSSGNGTNYNWNRGNRGNGWGWGNDRGGDVLDESLWDLVNAFERQDRRALGRLVPRRGKVNIYMDDSYCYSLEADDFYDLLLDNIETTRTVRYEIERVRTWRDEAQVTARHEYVDPWGRRSSVYHNFRLEEDRYGYIITDFRTSWRR